MKEHFLKFLLTLFVLLIINSVAVFILGNYFMEIAVVIGLVSTFALLFISFSPEGASSNVDPQTFSNVQPQVNKYNKLNLKGVLSGTTLYTVVSILILLL